MKECRSITGVKIHAVYSGNRKKWYLIVAVGGEVFAKYSAGKSVGGEPERGNAYGINL